MDSEYIVSAGYHAAWLCKESLAMRKYCLKTTFAFVLLDIDMDIYPYIYIHIYGY